MTMQFQSTENGIVFDVTSPSAARMLQNPAKSGLVTKAKADALTPVEPPKGKEKTKGKAKTNHDDVEQELS